MEFKEESGDQEFYNLKTESSAKNSSVDKDQETETQKSKQLSGNQLEAATGSSDSFSKASLPRISPIETLITLLVSFLTWLYCFPASLTLDFFKHTEADRALIGWSMLEDGDYIIPHLLGDKILTKPPLFYFLISISYRLWGQISEASARYPSILFSALLTGAVYIFSIKLGQTRSRALLSSIVLATSAAFYRYSTLAEIDLTFTFFCSLSAMALVIGSIGHTNQTSKKNFWMILLAYSLFGLAILTKGLAAPIFFGTTLVGCFFASYKRFPFTWHLLAFTLGILPVLIWIMLLTDRVGLEALKQVFEEEIILRVTNDPSSAERSRGMSFYISGVLASFLPWSLILIALIIAAMWKRKKIFDLKLTAPSGYILTFTSIISIVLFSFSSGKSVRYVFPIFPFLSILTSELVSSIVSKLPQEATIKVFSKTLLLLSTLIPLTSIAWICIAIYYHPELARSENLWAALGAVIISGLIALLIRYQKSVSWKKVVTIFLITVFTIRLSEALIVAPIFNHQHGVKDLANQLANDVPKGETLYTIEMFERWICFYYQLNNRAVFRLTPKLVADKKDQKVYLLLNEEEEAWRVRELQNNNPETTVLKHYQSGRKNFLLVKTNLNSLKAINLKQLFPTNRTPPVS